MEVLRWLCHCRVALGIRVPNVCNFSFLIYMVPKTCKTKGGKGKRSKKDLQPETEAPADSAKDPSQGDRIVMVQ